ncbi:hypothetical protein F7725_022237 [Dissostichus mawsoni]|uniref:Uncharacterized protein n=1 Tax=Dissostichus mawsoni TaxID=36200 RepID=A0A7J5YX65_DISMA|nr:hypothetical protein F7725_022237 [Dissostichus mawsoni]
MTYCIPVNMCCSGHVRSAEAPWTHHSRDDVFGGFGRHIGHRHALSPQGVNGGGSKNETDLQVNTVKRQTGEAAPRPIHQPQLNHLCSIFNSTLPIFRRKATTASITHTGCSYCAHHQHCCYYTHNCKEFLQNHFTSDFTSHLNYTHTTSNNSKNNYKNNTLHDNINDYTNNNNNSTTTTTTTTTAAPPTTPHQHQPPDHHPSPQQQPNTTLTVTTTKGTQQTKAPSSAAPPPVQTSLPKETTTVTVSSTTTENIKEPVAPGKVVEDTVSALTLQLVDTASLLSVLLFGLLFFLVSVAVFVTQAYESYRRKDYTQVDYLINGMYTDSGV